MPTPERLALVGVAFASGFRCPQFSFWANDRSPKMEDYSSLGASKWRRRVVDRRISGLYDELRPGKPRNPPRLVSIGEGPHGKNQPLRHSLQIESGLW
jgi:hypothetical protein